MASVDYGTWGEGSCWRLAAAVKEWARLSKVPAKYVVLLAPGTVHHVLVLIDDSCFIDSDGMSNEETLLTNWWKWYNLDLVIADMPPKRLLGEIPVPGSDMKRLGRLMFEHLGNIAEFFPGCW